MNERMGRGVMEAKKLRGFPIIFSTTTHHLLIILLPLIFLVLLASERCTAISTSLNYTKLYNRQVSSLRLSRIQRHLDKINKPPLFTIESSDGDIIDCVHKRKQPALDHPLLKNHKIQKVPPELPKSTKKGKTSNGSTISVDGSKGVWQMWHQNGQLCPKGTVPIRRSNVHDVLRAKSIYDFGKKKQFPNSLPPHRRGARPITDSDPPDLLNANGHEVFVNLLNRGPS